MEVMVLENIASHDKNGDLNFGNTFLFYSKT